MFIGQYQQQWNEAIQQRVKNTSSMLGSIKEIKVTGLEGNIATNIQKQREQELESSRPFFWGIIWLNGLGNRAVSTLASLVANRNSDFS